MATIDYTVTKVSDPFSRYFGYGQNQDHTHPFWTTPHAKVVINNTTTKTNSGVTITDEMEFCCEVSSLSSHTWTATIKIDGVVRGSTSNTYRGYPLIVVYKFKKYHVFESRPESEFDDWKANLKPDSKPPNTTPIYLNNLDQRKTPFYEPENSTREGRKKLRL